MIDTQKDVKPLKVAYYIRVSTDDQIDKYGADLQKRSLDAMVQSKGVLLDGKTSVMQLAGKNYIYRDEGVSGTIPMEERPEFSRLQEDISRSPEGDRPFDVVAVYRIDRFARRLKILLDVVEFFEKNDIKFISVNESIDTNTPFGKAILGIVGVLSELEIETIRERTHAGKKEAIEKGVYMGSVPPYGYIKDKDKRLIPLDKEEKIVRLIYDKYINERLSLNGICRYLEEKQIISPDISAVQNKKRSGTSKKKSNIFFWRIVMVKKILSDPIYLGRYYYGKTKDGKQLPKNEWKLSPYRYAPIIDILLFEKAQNLLKSTKKFHQQKNPNKHIYLLSGLLKCASCYNRERDSEHGMQTWHGEPKEIGKGTKNYSYYYNCRRKTPDKTSIRCTTLPLPATQIENYVVDRVKELFKDPKTVFDYQTKLHSTKKEIEILEKDFENLRKLLNAVPERISNLKEQHEHGIIKTIELEKRIEEISKQEKRYSKELLEVETKIAKKGLDKRYIDSLKLFSSKYKSALKDTLNNRKQVQQILRMVIEDIIVYSRPLNENDTISGRRSRNQQIPYKIGVRLKLPQEYLQQLRIETEQESKRFGLNEPNW